MGLFSKDLEGTLTRLSFQVDQLLSLSLCVRNRGVACNYAVSVPGGLSESGSILNVLNM